MAAIEPMWGEHILEYRANVLKAVTIPKCRAVKQEQEQRLRVEWTIAVGGRCRIGPCVRDANSIQFINSWGDYATNQFIHRYRYATIWRRGYPPVWRSSSRKRKWASSAKMSGRTNRNWQF